MKLLVADLVEVFDELHQWLNDADLIGKIAG